MYKLNRKFNSNKCRLFKRGSAVYCRTMYSRTPSTEKTTNARLYTLNLIQFIIKLFHPPSRLAESATLALHRKEAHMHPHTPTSKRILLFALALCFCATFLLSSGFALADTNHTHTCGDETHADPEDCVDVRECCSKCVDFYNTKNLIPTPAPTIAYTLPAHTESSAYAGNALAYAGPSTLTSLKIRLNN